MLFLKTCDAQLLRTLLPVAMNILVFAFLVDDSHLLRSNFT